MRARDIALARFERQTYNWKKSNKELEQIYGCSSKTVTWLRTQVPGALNQRERWAEARAIFRCHQEHHKLPYKKVAKIYNVAHSFAQALLREVRGDKQSEKNNWHDNLIYSHPDFGVEGEHATVTATDIGKSLGVSMHMVASRRRKMGVLPPHKHWRRRTLSAISKNDKRAYKVCRLTHGWGRPKGMKEHLEALNER